MQQFIRAVSDADSTERDLLTLTELCVSECVELLNRSGVPYNDPIHFKMSSLQHILDQALLDADGYFMRVQRIRRMGKILENDFGQSPNVTA
jgi:hypothetical protein